MDRKLLNSLEIDKIRSATGASRGGLRTRGGRLPPVNVREIAQITSSKKIVAPKIPQRRSVVKREAISEEAVRSSVKREPDYKHENSRGRGRGRGAKVFLQTEGTFLAEGPALKVKKEPIALETFSIPRCSGSSANFVKSEAKIDIQTMNNVLTSYQENEAYFDEYGTIPPVRFPLLQRKLVKIKSEPDEPLMPEIKQEYDEDELRPIEKICKREQELDVKENKFLEKISNSKDGGGIAILMKFPDSLPFDKEDVYEVKNEESKENTNGTLGPQTILDAVESGPVGKLQILRSGTMRLILGGMTFYLECGGDAGVSEAVYMNFHGDEAEMAVLARIDQKLILSPKIEELVR